MCRATWLIAGSLLLPLGCGGPTGLVPSEFCSDHSDVAIATFEDAGLEREIRSALSVDAQKPLSCGRIARLTRLPACCSRITSLVGIQNLTSLRDLNLFNNLISDLSALSGLTSLTDLRLQFNSITDISALSGLTSLTVLKLDGNARLSNIQPLLDNTGLGPGDTVSLFQTSVSCTDVAALKDKGVSVSSDCRN